MSVTFAMLQKQFEDLHRQGAIPTSVTIAEVDYDAFFESMWPRREWTPFERELLGAARLANRDKQRASDKRSLAGIVNLTTGEPVRLIRDPNAASGIFGMEWVEQ